MISQIQSIDNFAKMTKARHLIIRFCTLILKNPNLFIENQDDFIEYFYCKYEIAKCNTAMVYKNARDMFDIGGIKAIEFFRDEVKSELNKAAWHANVFDSPIGKN